MSSKEMSTMLCSFVVACGVFFFFFFFVCPGLRVEDEIDRCEELILIAEFLVFSCFCILATHVSDLVCTK
jgi:hypothetical protein